ncbi:MAG TPA: twin-arginine translocation signal domain-containing protein [Sedimentisphaerales bacterium]|nr:twin-arginine translocation signal domain-containing protein [Phycisphaerae bacterium]HON90823.1 twin-arginine translocation signal domain-containing protein [Sedimentisphaerales bacterium]HQI28399.1 twin-arginine translocation signal domain-containing protein [Sedimentisphaerales bacterium]
MASRMTRRDFVRNCAAGVSLLTTTSLVAQQSPATQSKRPNIILIVADDPQHKATLDRMKAKLKAFQEQTKDPWILKWEYE